MGYTGAFETEAFALTDFTISCSEDNINGAYVYSADYTLASTGVGGVITVTTEPRLEGPLVYDSTPVEPDYPTAGAVLVQGEMGNTMRIDADTGNPATAEIQIDSDTPFFVNWTDIDSPL